MKGCFVQLDAFDFELPEERIALHPAAERDGSRLLQVTASGALQDRMMLALPSLLEAGDLLVVNDSRVLPAALNGVRRRGELVAEVHVNLHKRVSEGVWRAFAKPAKRLRQGDRLFFGDDNNSCMMGGLEAEVTGVLGGGEIELSFDVVGAVLDERLKMVGAMPLPPYIAGKRPATDADFNDYQTIFSRHDGSVAAPTAGLHFTPRLLDALSEKGVKLASVTLHVGAGTFLPVKVDDVSDHKMHSEWGVVSAHVASQINHVKAAGGKVCAVGTTSLRLLETAALAAKASGDGAGEVIAPWSGETDIFITPGHEFLVADRLLTNFHLPKSTLFMLVAAFSGLEVMQAAYAHAIREEYRFYSYGDACWLEGARRDG